MSPPGSHKPNTAIAQAYYNKAFGIKKLSTETGAGQWGSALGHGLPMFGLELQVFMVRVSYNQKPYRRLMMSTWGANCFPSPSDKTQAGRNILAQDPDCPGSLGIAISEAVEHAVSTKDCRYSLGSVLNHVLLHQTIIGLEAKKQFEKIGKYPDVVIGCAGGGSNFGGIALPYVYDKIHGKKISIIASEPSSCPTLTKGPFAYDFGDVAKMTPLLPMHTLGHDFIPEPIHAGGLRYHGMAPIVSHLREEETYRGPGLQPDRNLRGGHPLGANRGVHPRPGDEPCHCRRRRRGKARQGRRQGEDHSLQLQRPRDHRSALLRRLFCRENFSPTSCPTRDSAGPQGDREAPDGVHRAIGRCAAG